MPLHKQFQVVVGAVLLVWVAPGTAQAKKMCRASDSVAMEHWKKYAELARKYRCASTVHQPGPQLAATRARCDKDPMKAAKIAAGMARFYAKKYGGLERKLKRPRRLTFAARIGKLKSTLGRTWIAPEPLEEKSTTVEFRKLAGGSKASIEVCAHSADGKSKAVWNRMIEPGRRNSPGRAFTKKLRGVRGKLISVTVDAKSVVKKLDYTLRLKRPGQAALRKIQRSGGHVTGFADVHNHQLSGLAWAGAWIWPGVDEPMRACAGDNHGRLIGGGEFKGKHPDRKNPKDWWHHLDTTHPQVHMDLLEQAHKRGLNLIVMSAVANREMIAFYPKKTKNADFPLDESDSIKFQLRAAKALAKQYDWYQIAHDPWEARRIIASGKLAVVLGVEYSDVMPKKHGDWRHQLEELYYLGVRSFVMAHERDSRFAGSAYHHSGTLEALQRVHKPLKRSIAKPRNPLGITPTGRKLVRELARRSMLIEADHLSRVGRRDLYNMVSRKGAGPLTWYPVFFTHGRFEALVPTVKEFESWVGKKGGYKAARMVGGRKGMGEMPNPDQDALWARATGAVYGIRTGASAMRTYKRSGVANKCHTSSRSIAQLYGYGIHRFGLAMSLGSDMSGPTVVQPAPRFGPEACSKLSRGDNRRKDRPLGTTFDTQGQSHIGLMPDLIADLGNLGMDTKNLESSAENFLRMWQRAHDKRRRKLDAAGYRAMMGTDAPDDVRRGDVLSSVRGGVGTVPRCPKGNVCRANK